MNPMDSPGAGVDIETGHPEEAAAEERTAQKKTRQTRNEFRLITDYEQVVNDLAGEGGVILRKLAALYANRIDHVLKQDEQCRAYQAIFDELKVTINIGKTLTTTKIIEIEERAKRGI